MIKDSRKSWILFFEKYLIDFEVEKKAKDNLKPSQRDRIKQQNGNNPIVKSSLTQMPFTSK